MRSTERASLQRPSVFYEAITHGISRGRSFLVLAMVFAVGCSTMSTTRAATDLTTITTDQRYQLRVLTGNPAMDRLLYEFAFAEFGGMLPLTENEPFTGALEITFVSTAESAFLGTSSGFATSSAYGSAWYTGGGYATTVGSATAAGTSIVSGGDLTWQNSTMLVTLNTAAGQRLWVADYQYKGGFEMSGFVVNTADEAARLCVERVAERFSEDFR